MSVRGTLVGCTRDDGRGVEAFFLCDVVNREGVFVITIANVTAIVLLIRATILDALRIVDIAVLTSAARAVWVGNVVDVDVDQSSSAFAVARLRANGNGVAKLLVLQDVLVRLRECLAQICRGLPLRRCESGQQAYR